MVGAHGHAETSVVVGTTPAFICERNSSNLHPQAFVFDAVLHRQGRRDASANRTQISTRTHLQVPKLAKKIAQVRERLDNSLVASMDTSAEKVLQFLGQEEDMLDQHKDRCTKLMEYQVCCLPCAGAVALLKFIEGEIKMIACILDGTSIAMKGRRIGESEVSENEHCM